VGKRISAVSIHLICSFANVQHSYKSIYNTDMAIIVQNC
jgi:hypothetical protein